MNKAAFLDRDGVINFEKNYVYKVDDFALIPGVIEALKMLQDMGFLLVIITNQAGIAKGYYGLQDLYELHAHLEKKFGQEGVHFDGIYFCPHHPESIFEHLAVPCSCRKPQPGMILNAAKDLNIDLDSSVLFGDKVTDIKAAKLAGLSKSYLLRSGHSLTKTDEIEADYVSDNLLTAVHDLRGLDGAQCVKK